MNTMYDQLQYIRSLLLAMQNLNSTEENLSAQFRQPQQLQNTVAKRKRKLVHPVVVFCVLMLLCCTNISSTHRTNMQIYESAVANDEFAWRMNHRDNPEPYPGYDGKEPSVVKAVFEVILVSLPSCAGIAACYGFVWAMILRADRKECEAKNDWIESSNAEIQRSNSFAVQRNAELKKEIDHIHQRKRMISQQYVQCIQQWRFPQKFGYLAAVDYFIDLVENNMVDTYREAVMLYLEDLRHRELVENQYEMINNQRIIINNQEITISNQDALLRQQMVGNMINMANYCTNMSTNAEARRAANAAERTANSAAQIAQKVNDLY